jgi:NAD(P)-dependent dehydrogenase (short-subunit alcohol dehydrogenase family)
VRDLNGKVAVVTGAASGIGRALAQRFGEEGMKLVLADVETGTLERAARELSAAGCEARPVPTDVSDPAAVEALARSALDAFGAVHVVCNNAGVFAGGLCWEMPLSDYEWVLGVNLWGVVHGIRTFVPILLRQDEEGHVVNTASMAALVSGQLSAPYTLSKHAVLSLSETLYHELTQRGAKVGVSALCPELVATRIGEAGRNRPAHLGREPGASPERDMVEGAIRALTPRGAPPSLMADRVVDAIRERRFYVLAEGDDLWRKACETRLDDIRAGRNPTHVVPVPDL